MSVSPHVRGYSKNYLTVACPCGRALRARIDQVGESIHCWDCRREVAVPAPRSLDRLGRLLSLGVRNVFSTSSVAAILATAALATGVLLIPAAGRPLIVLLAGCVTIGYGMLIRRIGLHGRDDEAPLLAFDRADLLRAAVSLALGAFALTPWLITERGLGHPPRISLWGWAPAVLVMFGMPLAMLVVWGPLGPRQAVRIGPRYPFTVAGCVAVLPAALVLAEVVAALFACGLQIFSPLVVDVFPQDPAHYQRAGLPSYGFYPQHQTFPTPGFARLYGVRLANGYCLATGVPSSLTDPTTVGNRAYSFYVDTKHYLLGRLMITFVTAVIVLLALALQARWLGLLARVDSREAVMTPTAT